MLAFQAQLLLLLLCGVAVHGATIAALSKHDPSAWSKESGCKEADNLRLVQCNLGVYERAVEKTVNATSNGVDLFLFPEGYGLANGATVGLIHGILERILCVWLCDCDESVTRMCCLYRRMFVIAEINVLGTTDVQCVGQPVHVVSNERR